MRLSQNLQKQPMVYYRYIDGRFRDMVARGGLTESILRVCK